MLFDLSQQEFLSVLCYNITFNVDIEFLRITTSEPIVSTEQAVLRDSHPKNFR